MIGAGGRRTFFIAPAQGNEKMTSLFSESSVPLATPGAGVSKNALRLSQGWQNHCC